MRVSFILGNVTAKNETARQKLFEQHRCMETLLYVLKHYLEQDLKAKVITGVWKACSIRVKTLTGARS